MKTSFDYVPEMAKSELWLEFKAKVGNKEVVIPAVKVADGVISTSELVNNTLGSANPALGEDAFQRIIKEKHDANIMFLIQQANIRSSELKTAKEFNQEVANVNSAENKKISNIEVSAYTNLLNPTLFFFIQRSSDTFIDIRSFGFVMLEYPLRNLSSRKCLECWTNPTGSYWFCIM